MPGGLSHRGRRYVCIYGRNIQRQDPAIAVDIAPVVGAIRAWDASIAQADVEGEDAAVVAGVTHLQEQVNVKGGDTVPARRAAEGVPPTVREDGAVLADTEDGGVARFIQFDLQLEAVNEIRSELPAG